MNARNEKGRNPIFQSLKKFSSSQDKIRKLLVRQVSNRGGRIADVFLTSFRYFNRHQGFSAASALTYYTLLSLVPVLAVIIGVAKGFGFQDRLETALLERFEQQELVLSKLFQFAHAALENAEESSIGGVGALILFYTIIRLINEIEEIFNQIWEVEHGRPWRRKFTDYLSVFLLGPVLFFSASSFNIFFAKKVTEFGAYFEYFSLVNPFLRWGLRLLPYTILWALLSFLYIFIPNTSVPLRWGILAGIIGGTLYQLWQWLYFLMQLYVVDYGAVYGSFAAIPLFLIWLQISWVIVIFGAELSSTLAQGAARKKSEERFLQQLSHRNFVLLGWPIMAHISLHFQRGDGPISLEQLGQHLQLPSQLLKKVIDRLISVQAVAEVHHHQDHGHFYVPQVPLENETLSSLKIRMEKCSGSGPIQGVQGKNSSSPFNGFFESPLAQRFKQVLLAMEEKNQSDKCNIWNRPLSQCLKEFLPEAVKQ